MISDQLLNRAHTQPHCLLNKSKVVQAVKRFGTAVQLSGWSVYEMCCMPLCCNFPLKGLIIYMGLL